MASKGGGGVAEAYSFWKLRQSPFPPCYSDPFISLRPKFCHLTVRKSFVVQVLLTSSSLKLSPWMSQFLSFCFFFFLDESISWTVSLSDHPRSVSFPGSLSWSLFSYGQVLFTSPCPHSSVSWHPLHLYVSNCHKAISLWCFKLTAFFQSSSLFCDPLLGIIDPSENLIKTMELLPQKNVQIFSYNSRALLDLPGTHTPLI